MLYNKYRPTEFNQVLDQPAAIVLQNLVNHPERVRVHSVMLTGTRGVGKTTLMRIFARGLNCTSAKHRPCGKCDSCQEANHPDIIEVDSAVTGNPSAIESLVERMALRPTYRSKVYIFDEAHMLTKKSMAILLKTVEEPSLRTYVGFLTTEPDKIDRALRSRCMWLQLKPLSKRSLARLLAKVSLAERFRISRQAIDLLVEYANGSARDALSLLETVRYMPEISTKALEQVVGQYIDTNDMLTAMVEIDIPKALNEINRLCSYHDAKAVLQSAVKQITKRMSDQVLAGRDARHYLLLLDVLNRNKRELPYEHRPQTLIEVTLFEYLHESGKMPPKTIILSDWKAFVYWLLKEDKKAAKQAAGLRFARLKRENIVVCRSVTEPPPKTKRILPYLRKYANRTDLELEIV